MLLRYTGAVASGVIAAPIDQVWGLVSDVTRHPEIAGSGEVQSVTVVGAGPLTTGGVFQSEQCMHGLNYVTANKVMAWQPPYRFAWKVGFPGLPGVAQTWLFDLTPVNGGTRVENGVALVYTFPNVPPFTWLSNAIARRYARSITPTLANIARILAVSPPTQITVRETPPDAALAHMPPPVVQGAVMAFGGLVALGVLRRAVRR